MPLCAIEASKDGSRKGGRELVDRLNSSWPGIAVRRTASLPLAYARPSTPFGELKKDVDARDKRGHDG